jgi:hypothetical protein
MAAATKKRKEEAYPWEVGISSGHITNLKQSILETFDIYGLSQKGFCNIFPQVSKFPFCPCMELPTDFATFW